MWDSTRKAVTLVIVTVATTEAASAVPNLDGAVPVGGLAVSGTTVFGTAAVGGQYRDGTLWSFDTSSDTFTKLHDFHLSSDGAHPQSGLALSGATIFGTTAGCCTGEAGTIWSFDTSTSAFSKLHHFDRARHGQSPFGDLALSGATLYGVTLFGGSGEGTVWSFDSATNEFKNLHEFVGGVDGSTPAGGVVERNGVVFGTASEGGHYGDGMVWSIDTRTEDFTNLHDFDSRVDGKNPRTNVALSGTAVIGTTRSGGPGAGTIWSFDTDSNTFMGLHNFSYPTDGGGPNSGGVAFSGTTLYGTTWQGGGFHDFGTLWSFDTDTDTFTTLHVFKAIDGVRSVGNVAVSGTTIFGTSSDGGKYDKGTFWSFDISSETFAKLHDFGSPPGDFNGNKILDTADIDILSEEVRLGNGDLAFDLNDDFALDFADVRVWVEDLRGTFFGDANLDGEFNSTDLVAIFEAGEYDDEITLNSTWATGDWNADAEFDSGDLVFAFAGGGYEFGPRPMVANAVPEPTSLAILIIAGVGILIRRRCVVS